MKTILACCFLLLSVSSFSQQDSVAPLTKDSLYWGPSIIILQPPLYMNGKPLQSKQGKKILAQVPEALDYYHRYKQHHTFFLAGVGVTTLLALDVPNFGGSRAATLFPAIGTFVATYIFYRAMNRNAEKTVNKWNEAMGY